MNNILEDVEQLKNKVLNSKEYKDYKMYEQKLDNNKEINNIITKIKRVQQQIIKKGDKSEDVIKEKIELI